jgi:hypothetical protein
MTNCEYPLGIDCVWIASDYNGNIGAFVTGGEGPIPCSALRDKYFLIDDVEEALCDLPLVSGVRLLVSMPRPDDFIEMAKRGFFVYDWRDVHRTSRACSNMYEQIAVPQTPIALAALPVQMRSLASSVNFSPLAFENELSLSTGLKFECKSGK